MELFEFKTKILTQLLDEFIPESKKYEMPSGSIIFDEIINDISNEVVDIIIDFIANNRSVNSNSEIVLKDIIFKNNKRLYFSFCQDVIKKYYSNSIVVEKILSRSAVPFPLGNSIKDSMNYDLLEKVYLMDCKYKKC